MPISFANVGLTPLHEHHELAAQFWHAHRINEFDHQTFFVPAIQQFPTPYPPQREPPALGRLHWPTGADRWSTCHLVATGTQVEQLRSIIGTTPTAQTLLITDGTTAGTIETEMYLLPPRPICQKGSDEWFLLTIVDSRFWWHQCGSAEIPDPPGTWSEFLEALFALLGESPLIDVIPSEYLEPNALRWTTGIQPIPIVIECVCKQIGMRVVRNLDGVVEVVTASSAQASDESRWSAIQNLVLNGGRLTGADIGRMAPSSVDVIFFDGNTGTSTPVNVTLASLGLSGYEGVEGVSAGIGRITADPLTSTGPQQTAYALQASTDYYNWLLGLTDATLRGIVNINPEGLDDFVEWVHHPDMLVTRILRSQWADRNIYGELGVNFPNPNWIPGGGSGGSGGSGSGSGSGNDGCTAAVNPVTVECEEGERVLRSTVLAVGLNSEGQFVLSQCETLDYPLGPCSPVDPNGTTLSAVVMVCPIYADCVTVTSDYTAQDNDYVIFADTSGGDIVISLPTALPASTFIVVNTGTGQVTVQADINGTTEITITDQWGAAFLQGMCETEGYAGQLLSSTGGGGTGTVESITVTTANGMQVSGGTTQTITTTGTFALTLPITLAGSGTITNSGSTSLTSFTGSGTCSGTNTGNQNLFETIAVSGQSSVVADSPTDTLTLAAGSGVTITTNATTDTVTISATGSGGTVTSITVETDNGISVNFGTSSTITTSGTFSLTLPFDLAGSGTLTNSGTSSVSGSNTGDQTTSGTTNQVSVATGTTNPVISLAGPHNFTTLTIHGILLGQTTGAITATAAMTDGQILVGQSSADPLPKTMSGDATLAASGAIEVAGTLLGASVVDTSQSTSSTTNTNLTTVQSVTLNLPTSCRILVRLGATASHDTVNGSARLVIDLDGTDKDGPTCRCTAATLLFPCTGGDVDLGTVSSGSHTFTMQFRTNTGTVTFEKRSMAIYRCPP